MAKLKFKPKDNGHSNPLGDSQFPQLPQSSKFIACVRRPESAKKVHQALPPYLVSSPASLSILQNNNVSAVQQADIVLLSCKPYMVKEILSEPGMGQA